ncbi:MAG: hypothetical protein A2W90_17600 [Bacteroidetes bacterium GWF2_42_66]|nr:MAG: hypothetical protein A2W92_16745 [Bacteroidetes bacterium GWA2_42_15]OFX98074.1 MAG: hypothetical protein A2W89_09090 [Bacteroidetes bacterium GWE2_42_39]OFY42457.1 MAG: hypothetical protein A2W90_17600 [Bacteroidetes bacterium GWF2_42_66]HBL74168.1 hypothetical protein [Prolixibacteraceae bacterium]HCR91654.1 hypothetical protein [Prolixibacteraceae bacterium]
MKKLAIVSIFFLGILLNVRATNSIWVSGKVSDPSGNAIPGVTVTVQENGKYTVTDQAGEYKILAERTAHLIFTFAGFQEKTVAVNGNALINITLFPSALEIVDSEVELSECVVVGYGSQQKSAMTGAVSMAANRGKNFSFAKQSYMAEGMRTPDWNTENYAAITENGYKDVFANPLSTFSIDVDNASYSNVRRFLNMGQMPPMDAVRIEEMINYFSYNYNKPGKKEPFSINSELTSCPWNSNHQLLLVALQAKEIEKESLPPSNLVFLLDVSGSMNAPNKLPLVKSAMQMLVNELRPNDRVAIVVYAGAAGLVLESTPGNQKQKIMESIEKLDAGGSTAGGEGLRLAYKTARENFTEGGNNRIILATDGDFNVGVSSTSEMERLVEKERESGIFMTVLGFGMGNYKDDKMETIADKGNGNYAYIDNILEARKVFVKEFGGTLFTVAKDVKLQLEFNPQYVKAYRLIGYENRLLNDEDFKDDKKDAGEMGAGHRVTALYEIIPAGSVEKVPEIDELKYQQRKKEADRNFSNELVTIKARYKALEGNQSFPMEKVVSPQAAVFEKASENIRFASAVAGFGMLLRNSEYKGTISYEEVARIAKDAKGDDEEGYRGEFVRLVKVAESLAQPRAEE